MSAPKFVLFWFFPKRNERTAKQTISFNFCPVFTWIFSLRIIVIGSHQNYFCILCESNCHCHTRVIFISYYLRVAVAMFAFTANLNWTNNNNASIRNRVTKETTNKNIWHTKICVCVIIILFCFTSRLLLYIWRVF